MESKTKTIFIISIFAGLIIIAILLYLVFGSKGIPGTTDAPPDQVETSTTNNLAESKVTAPAAVQDVPRTVDPGSADQGLVAKQTARVFVERFGTYSSQNNNEHIRAVREMLTPTMLAWVDTQAIDQSATFQGSTTEVIASTLTEFNETNAMVAVQVRQIVETETESTTSQRNGRVELVQENGTWLVHGFYWD